MKLKNVYLALKDQMPFQRLVKNVLSGDILGLLHKRSHWTHQGTEKISYSEKSARKAALRMSEKKGVHFSVFKCLYCDGYHIGKHVKDQEWGKEVGQRKNHIFNVIFDIIKGKKHRE